MRFSQDGGEKKMEIALIIAVFLGGGGVGFGISQAVKPKNDVIQQDKTAEEQQLVIKQLTDLDLIIPMCSPVKEEKQALLYASTDQALMCRYLACLQFSRGIDSKTGGNGECEQISNILNKKAIIELCNKEESIESKKSCVDLFDRRL